MKIAVVYSSKAEQRRIARIKRKMRRLGIATIDTILKLCCVVSTAGMLIFACLVDSTNFDMMFGGFVLCMTGAAVSAGLISLLGR